jgi:hypothetical protein
MPAKKLLTVLFAAASLAVLSAGPALASGGWTTTKVPSGAGPLASVSCWSSNGCLSVGSEALLWNGTAWTAIATPPESKALDGVACTAASFCLAVGQNDSALAAAWKWNGTSWQNLVVYNPGSTDNVLNAVKCASATNCEAVGGHGDGSDSTTYPLAEVWNGSSMQKQSTYGAPHGELYGVSCESSSKCEAVGADFDGTSTDCIPPPDGAGCPVPDALAMGWTGTMWQTQATPVQPFMDYNNMFGPGTSNWQDTAVSCWSSGCMASGWQDEASDPSSVQPAPYAEYWNGTSWSVSEWGNTDDTLISSYPSISCTTTTVTTGGSCAGSGGALTAIHCTSAANCTAAGFFYGYPGPYLTGIVQWNGTQWSQVPSPTPDWNSVTGTGPGDAFTGLACTSAVCTAVGSESSTDYMDIGGGPGTVVAARI